jgi:hypothetical protein
MAQLGGDDVGRLLLSRHRRRQGKAKHVRVGNQPDACGEAGEGAAGVVGG